MIANQADLKRYLYLDNQGFRATSRKEKLISWLVQDMKNQLRYYLILLRKQEYYINTANGSRIRGFLALWYERKKNRLGMKLGIEIGPNCFGPGLHLYHGGIVVNPAVRAGSFCKLHGGNCIGNDGKSEEIPQIGDRVDFGYGSSVIGNIRIADDCVIGSGAVVIRSFESPSSVIVGVPAKIKC